MLREYIIPARVGVAVASGTLNDTGWVVRASSSTVVGPVTENRGLLMRSAPFSGAAGSTSMSADRLYVPRGSRTVVEPDDRSGKNRRPEAMPVCPFRSACQPVLGAPSRPVALKVTSYVSASRSTAAAVRTVWPPPVATTVAE